MLFKIENSFTWIPTLYEIFDQSMTIPTFYFIVVFFIAFVITSESLFYFAAEIYHEKKEARIKKAEQRRMERIRISSFVVVPARETFKHLGFAFS